MTKSNFLQLVQAQEIAYEEKQALKQKRKKKIGRSVNILLEALLLILCLLTVYLGFIGIWALS